jgi:hypothetical protein
VLTYGTTGEQVLAKPFDVTVNGATTGANALDTGALAAGWYYVWMISTGTTHAALISLSGTAPTLPVTGPSTGYGFKVLVGAIYYTGSAWRPFLQSNDRVWQAAVDLFTSAETPGTSYAVLTTTKSAVTNFRIAVPPIARTAIGYIGVVSGGTPTGACSVRVSACDDDGVAVGGGNSIGECTIQMADSTLAFSSSTKSGAGFDVPLLTPIPDPAGTPIRNLQWKGVSGCGACQMSITGYTV